MHFVEETTGWGKSPLLEGLYVFKVSHYTYAILWLQLTHHEIENSIYTLFYSAIFAIKIENYIMIFLLMFQTRFFLKIIYVFVLPVLEWTN